MGLRRSASAVGVALSLIGHNADPRAPQQTRGDARSGDFAQLASAFRRAHDTRDLPALEALVHRDGLDADGLNSFRMLQRIDGRYKVASVRFLPLDPSEKLEYVHRGRTWRPNLRPTGRMEVTFKVPAKGAGLTATSSTYLVGVVDGRYRIASAVAR